MGLGRPYPLSGRSVLAGVGCLCRILHRRGSNAKISLYGFPELSKQRPVNGLVPQADCFGLPPLDPENKVIAVVMNVKRRVAATARLALVSGSRKRLHPPHLPLWLLPVLGSHLVQLGSPCLLSEASCAALLIVLVQPMRVSGPFKFWTGATQTSENAANPKFAQFG
jgi:hypothetical protein